jgi:enoyl-CoA hydratase/carnithine racemase
VGSVSTEIRGAVAIVTLDNAARRNAIDAEVASGLAAAAAALRKRKDVGALVLRGAGEMAFSAGFDLKFMEQFKRRGEGFAKIEKGVEAFCRHMASMPFPTIAMLRANCYGGGVQLAASADFRFGDDVLKLSVPAVRNRLYYSIGALERLYAIVGAARTRRVMLAGETFDARTLREWGFLDEVFPAADLERETLAFAAQLAGQPREVVSVYQDVFRALDRGDAAKARRLRLRAKGQRGTSRPRGRG